MKKLSLWIKSFVKAGSIKQIYSIYISAFALIALVAVLSQVFIQRYLQDQAQDSFLINVSGKQRMLSQKITKNILLYQMLPSKVDKDLLKKDLKYWKKRHLELRNGTLIPSKFNTAKIDSMYRSMEPLFYSIHSKTYNFLEKSKPIDIESFTQSSSEYLEIMDAIVNEYDKNEKGKINKLKNIELWLAAFLLFILTLEMLLVFLPLIRMIGRNLNNLLQSEKKAKDLAFNLKLVNIDLKKRNKLITDTNLALDKAVLLIKTDPLGNIIYTNQQYCDLTKYTKEELIGKPIFYNNVGGKESIIYDHIRDQKMNRKVWQEEIHDTAFDKTSFWLYVTLFPVINDEGELYEYLVICNDITKRKVAEKELEALNEKRFNKQEQEQRIRSKSIIEGQEVERKRIAIEFHDGLGQMLTALKFNIEALNPDESKQKVIVSQIKNLLQQVIIETRRISSDLLPTVLSDFGLSAALKEMISIVTKNSDILIRFSDETDFKERLPGSVEIALYRIAQESINNSIKHSNATLIEIKLVEDVEYIYLDIRDNGVGGAYEQENLYKNSGNGMRNMRERARLIEGEIYVTSGSNAGTHITVEIQKDKI